MTGDAHACVIYIICIMLVRERRRALNEPNGRYPVPPFLVDENPAHEQYHEATELFALFDYLKSQRFGVFSIRESLQAVGERRDGTLQGFHLSAEEAWECVVFVASLGVGVVELPAYPANRYGQAFNQQLIARAACCGFGGRVRRARPLCGAGYLRRAQRRLSAAAFVHRHQQDQAGHRAQEHRADRREGLRERAAGA